MSEPTKPTEPALRKPFVLVEASNGFGIFELLVSPHSELENVKQSDRSFTMGFLNVLPQEFKLPRYSVDFQEFVAKEARLKAFYPFRSVAHAEENFLPAPKAFSSWWATPEPVQLPNDLKEFIIGTFNLHGGRKDYGILLFVDRELESAVALLGISAATVMDPAVREAVRGIRFHWQSFYQKGNMDEMDTKGEHSEATSRSESRMECDDDSNPFDILPDESLVAILSHIHVPSDLVATELVCKRWQRLVIDVRLHSWSFDSSTIARGLGFAMSRKKLLLDRSERTIEPLQQAVRQLNVKRNHMRSLMAHLQDWYGQHFPELKSVLIENDIVIDEYYKYARIIGSRPRDPRSSMSILPALNRLTNDTRISYKLISTAAVSVGDSFSDNEMARVMALAQEIEEVSNSCDETLKMVSEVAPTLAPALCGLVGPEMAAQYISCFASLVSFARVEPDWFLIHKEVYFMLHRFPLVQSLQDTQSQNSLVMYIAKKILVAVRLDAFSDRKTDNSDNSDNSEAKRVEKLVAMLSAQLYAKRLELSSSLSSSEFEDDNTGLAEELAEITAEFGFTGEELWESDDDENDQQAILWALEEPEEGLKNYWKNIDGFEED